MKSFEYVGITEEAAKQIVTNRELQSVDFASSQDLMRIFLGDSTSINENLLGVRGLYGKNGCVLIASGEKFSLEKNTLTLDLPTFDLTRV
ncbi:MAG: hypothetical protein C0490_26190, partial [Marivirga sp.]|nr:hypothetical protein [Marivirga sp.]